MSTRTCARCSATAGAGPARRAVLRRRQPGACRTALLTSLVQAGGRAGQQVYPGDADCSAGDQWCADSIIQRPMGGITDGKITWQNRPTYQQVVQFVGHHYAGGRRSAGAEVPADRPRAGAHGAVLVAVRLVVEAGALGHVL